MGQRIFQVDAFADEPFRGNPAAVVLLDEPRDDEWMQSVAIEMNLAETAFVSQIENSVFHLRWFTPAYEVDLCGHATLATAHILWQLNIVDHGTPIRFETRSGQLPVQKTSDGIELDFPATPATECKAPQDLLESFSFEGQPVETVFIGRSCYDYVLEFPSEASVRNAEIDIRRLRQVETRGVIISAASDDAKLDFVSRFFGPAAGIDEDPVTGSAHCCLAEYWGNKLQKNSLVGYQASSRGGTVRMQRRAERILLCGTAVTVLSGELHA